MKNKSFKGFTLVEVLIVIIIIGILIAALLPRLQGTQARARDTARSAHVNQIAQAAALYSADNDGKSASGCVDSTWVASGNLSTLPTDPNSLALTGSCTAGEYLVMKHGNNQVVVADVEGNGNCTVTAFDPTGAFAGTLGQTSGPHYCAVVQ